MQFYLVLGIPHKLTFQFLNRPFVIEVDLFQFVLTDLREEYGEAFRIKRIILISQMEDEGEVILDIRNIAVVAFFLSTPQRNIASGNSSASTTSCRRR